MSFLLPAVLKLFFGLAADILRQLERSRKPYPSSSLWDGNALCIAHSHPQWSLA